MAGRAFILPRSGTGPPVENDSLLSAGSLILLDPAHSFNPWAAGVPAHNSDIPNLASEKVATLLSATAGTQYPSKFLVGGAINNNTKGKIERTTKGALHTIVSQANSLASGDGVAVGIDTSIRTYLAANTGHRYYMSQWDRITRINAGTLSSTQAAEAMIGSSGISGHLVGMLRAGGASVVVPAASTTTQIPTDKTVSPDYNTAGERFVAFATETGTPSTSATSSTAFAGPMWGAYTGTYNNAALASRNTYWPSFVFRRFYLEDLTVSGRSFATVSALDQALWAAAVASDGRYGSDSFTAASSVA